MSLRRQPQPVVGIGASAGGLEALLEMLPRIRPSGRCRFVLAQHMARTGHTELVVRVLGRRSAIPVMEAADGMLIQPDVLYVLPSGSDGVYEDGRIHLREPGAGSHSAPSVNALLTSIARAVGEDAVAVVLSGAGSDGLIGCRDVRRHGGTVLVQAPATAGIHGMAGAVVREGLAHGEYSPVQLAARLNALTPEPATLSLEPHRLIGSSPMDALLERLSEHVGVDYTQYRQGTLLRRIERRAEILHMSGPDEYIRHAIDNPAELDVLHRMFMISWSWFFRDSDAWIRLRGELKRALTVKPADEPFRAWVPGCASGEEAYSIAMLLRELAEQRPVEVLGSDLNAEAIALARVGRYRPTALREAPPAMVERFMIAEPNGDIRISDHIRELCEFRVEDVLTTLPEPPMDLVSCRNILIYMRRELQDPLLRNIHQLLRPGGLLFLGQSESLSRTESLRFTLVDATHRIYRRGPSD